LLFGLAKAGCFRVAWSDVIGEEWCRNAARLWQLEQTVVAQQWQQMQLDFPDACFLDVEQHTAGLRYSDVKDWHVIAAARMALQQTQRPVVILTYNTRDFNRSELRRL